MPQAPIARRVAEEMAELFGRAWTDIVAETERAIASGRPLRRARLTEMRHAIEARLGALEGQAADWLRTRFPLAYQAGAQAAATEVGIAFSWSQIHVAAVQQLASDTYLDVLKATRYVRRDVKRLVREATRRFAALPITTDRTAVQAGRLMRNFLAENGLAAVRYANGARHGLGEYGEMVVRTKTAVAYNEGTLNLGQEAGVLYYEVFDGPNCGWSFHEDPTLALGLIVTEDDARSFPISHPNCRRSFGARPDLRTPAGARAAQGGQVTSRQTEAQREQDAARRAVQGRRARRARRERRVAQ